MNRRRHLAVALDYRPAELPTTWDDAEGREVRWSEWSAPMQIFICPPPKEPDTCWNCGSTSPKSTSQGKIMPRPGETVEVAEDVASKRVPGRFYERFRTKPAHPYIRLVAFRCPDCGSPEIYDELTRDVHIPPWDDPSPV